MGIGSLRRHYAPGKTKKSGGLPPATNEPPIAPVPFDPEELPTLADLPSFLEGKSREEIEGWRAVDDRKTAAKMYDAALEAE